MLMKGRPLVRTGRWMLWLAAWPLLQVGGCGAEFFSSAIATETANRVAIGVGTSVQTVLNNLFGV